MFIDDLVRNPDEGASFEGFFVNDRNLLSGHKKHRLCHRQTPAMREVHEAIVGWLRNKKLGLPWATGGASGDSAIKNVRLHQENQFFYLLDIKNAYNAVQIDRLAILLHFLEFRISVFDLDFFLRRYCSLPQRGRGLVVGASSSQDLFNLYAHYLLDRPLSQLCRQNEITYSRYIDDLTFSSRLPIRRSLRRAIRGLIFKAGFQLSFRKAKLLDINKGPILLNGIRLSEDRRLSIPNHFRRRVRGLILKATWDTSISENVVHGHMGVIKSLQDWNRGRLGRDLDEAYFRFKKIRRVLSGRGSAWLEIKSTESFKDFVRFLASKGVISPDKLSQALALVEGLQAENLVEINIFWGITEGGLKLEIERPPIWITSKPS